MRERRGLISVTELTQVFKRLEYSQHLSPPILVGRDSYLDTKTSILEN